MDSDIIASLGAVLIPLPILSKLVKTRTCCHTLDSDRRNLKKAEERYPENTMGFLTLSLSDKNPNNAFIVLETKPIDPLTNPITISSPPRERIKTGRRGRIISLLTSFKKLTTLKRITFIPILLIDPTTRIRGVIINLFIAPGFTLIDAI